MCFFYSLELLSPSRQRDSNFLLVCQRPRLVKRLVAPSGLRKKVTGSYSAKSSSASLTHFGSVGGSARGYLVVFTVIVYIISAAAGKKYRRK